MPEVGLSRVQGRPQVFEVGFSCLRYTLNKSEMAEV
jgi:hypothetical protein